MVGQSRSQERSVCTEMSFLGSFNPVNIFKAAVKNPVKFLSHAAASGGLSIVSPQIYKAVDPLAKLYVSPQVALAAATGGGSLPFTGGFGGGGAQPMAFNIGGFLGNLGKSLGGSSNSTISAIGNIAGFAGQFVPQPVSQPMGPQAPVYGGSSYPVATLPARVGRSSLTREVFDAGQKILARIGLSYPASTGGFTRILKGALSSMAALARRTPAGNLVSILIGIGLTVYEANLLTAWHAQRKRGKRMNPANPRALRRAARRIKSFHKLCQHTDLIRTRSSRTRVSAGRSGRCFTCKKNPCRC